MSEAEVFNLKEAAEFLRVSERTLRGRAKTGQVPPLWDGYAARRIADVVEAWFGSRGD